jgi:hypothetical protein
VPSFSLRSPLTELPSVIDAAYWHFSDMVRCLTYVRSALKSGRTVHTVAMTKYRVRHRSFQPIIIGRKASKF